MSDTDPPPSDRTIIRPSKRKTPARPRAPASDAVDDRTRFEPLPAPATPAPAAPARPASAGQIAIGDVLNGTFEVKRFIARGGMGEVYEGINVHTDERLAIKVILPHLADDPNVQDLFRNEARTLQKLSHPALVRYVLLSKEMQFGVFYIVTEYIGGSNLSDVLGQLTPSPDDLIALTRRLAEGLDAAHALGAIHRDMAPDNVILQDGDIRKARIIDFGIAKDLNPGSRTIIGDGFGGKLGFVAPEQLGDFDRNVGAWSDVYSLALIILSIAQRQKVDMGATFVDAMNKRRNGVDTSAAPSEIRPVLDRMLVADPADRLRSMGEVLAALDAASAPAREPAKAARTPRTPKAPASKPVEPKGEERAQTPNAAPSFLPASVAGGLAPILDKIGDKWPLVAGGGAALLLLLAAGLYVALSAPAVPDVAVVPTATQAPNVIETVRTTVNQALPNIPCAWLDLTEARADAGGVSLAFSGVAGRTAEAEAAVRKAVASTGVHIPSADLGGVAPIPAAECDTIDAVRHIRAAPGVRHISSLQREYEMVVMAKRALAGKMGATAIIDLQLGGGIPDFALYALSPEGEMQELLPSRAALEAAIKNESDSVTVLGPNKYRLEIDADHTGWTGLVLLTGEGPFNTASLAGVAQSRPANWKERFAATAAKSGWKAEMTWYEIVKPQ